MSSKYVALLAAWCPKPGSVDVWLTMDSGCGVGSRLLAAGVKTGASDPPLLQLCGPGQAA